MTVLIFSGTGRYADPWHPIAETTEAIATVISELGLETQIVTDADPAALDLSGADLLVVNSGGGNPDAPPLWEAAWEPVYEAIDSYAAAGRPILGVHTAANAFPEWNRWAQIIGTGWERGVSGHPERSMAVFEAVPDQAGHPIFDGLEAAEWLTGRPGPLVIADDERYWKMPYDNDITPLLHHQSANQWHVMSWAHGDRVLYDGMGHDARAYQSPSRRRYLANAVTWLLRD